ncbi:MAG: amidohydrolase family protein [Streptosporangiaceae bacterium]
MSESALSPAGGPAPGMVAYVGATVIDGTGAPPISRGVVLTRGDRIIAVGGQRAVPIPQEARIVPLDGTFLMPGLIDGNVHLVPWPTWSYIEFLARYEDRFDQVAVEGAQMALRAGITTVFDSMGPLDALVAARDRIDRGDVPGACMFVAGNIVGFRAVFTTSASMSAASRAFQRRINDRFEAGAGPDLPWKTPQQIYDQIPRYAASGIDLVKYGATGDGQPINSEVGQEAVLRFSPDQQRAIVDAAHDAGKVVQTQTTSAESLHIAVEVGNDLGQHASMTGRSRTYQRTIERMLETGYHCGTQWAPVTEDERRIVAERAFPGDDSANWDDGVSFDLENAVRLIEAGVPQFMSTDAGWIDPDVAADGQRCDSPGAAASLLGETELLNLRAMADRGMSPMQVLRAATYNVARAYHVDDQIGSLRAGLQADLIVLDMDPLVNVEHLRSILLVVQRGREVDVVTLPAHPVLTSAAAREPGRIRRG